MAKHKIYSTNQVREKAIKSIVCGSSASDVAQHFDVHRSTVYRWWEAYLNTGNFERKPGSGRPSKLDAHMIARLTKYILKPASAFGFETDFWTTGRIRFVAKRKLRVSISKTTMWEILSGNGYSYKKPEKRYYEADEKTQQEWIRKEIPKIKKEMKKHRAILYFEDEASVSLTAVLGRTWGPRGKKVIQKVTGHRGAISAMSAISNTGRLIFTLHEKRISSDEIIHFLSQMLSHHPRRHLIVIMDQAPCHKSKKTREFVASQSRLHLHYLPPRSPELNADEKVWDHLKNKELKSHQATTTKELKGLAKKKLSKMAKNSSLLRGIFRRSEIASFFA